MTADGVMAADPWLRIAPVADVRSRGAASVPVAKAADDGLPVMPEAITKAPETLSKVTTGAVASPVMVSLATFCCAPLTLYRPVVPAGPEVITASVTPAPVTVCPTAGTPVMRAEM